MVKKEKLSKNQTLETGKDFAKFNKRKRFYNKFQRFCKTIADSENKNTIIPLTMDKKFVFPEYDDLSLLLLELIPEPEEDKETTEPKQLFSKDGALALPYIDDAHFIVEKTKAKLIEVVKQETFENDDGSSRKGSIDSSDTYNYQSAYNFGIKILNFEKLGSILKKEIEEPTTYNIEVKMKKIVKKTKYNKPWKPFYRRKR